MLKGAQITVSIVLYKSDFSEVKKALISCVQSSLIGKVFLIDNSPKNSSNLYAEFPNVIYTHVGRNLGFGKAHNSILTKIAEVSTYHLVLNPDVWFDPDILQSIIKPFELYDRLSLIAPQLLFPDKKIQVSSREFPTFLDLFKRFIGRRPSSNYFGTQVEGFDNCFETEFIHGAFYLFKTKDLIEIEGFDERYFLYLEDADICKKLQQKQKRVFYYSQIKAFHTLKRGSKNGLILKVNHIVSAFKYFFKWGFN